MPDHRAGQPRLAGLLPKQLTPEQQELYGAIAGGRRAQGPQLFPLVDEVGCLRGPFNAMLLSPPLGGPLQAVGAAVRYAGQLTDRERELAILTVAHRWASHFEWSSHEAVARHSGLSGEEIEAAKSGIAPPLADRREAAVVAWTRQLANAWTADDTAYDSAQDVLGLAIMYELTVLVGYYSTLALQLRVFAGEEGTA
jgi:4-carboxymuconolactone decarboxylase